MHTFPEAWVPSSTTAHGARRPPFIGEWGERPQKSCRYSDESKSIVLLAPSLDDEYGERDTPARHFLIGVRHVRLRDHRWVQLGPMFGFERIQSSYPGDFNEPLASTTAFEVLMMMYASLPPSPALVARLDAAVARDALDAFLHAECRQWQSWYYRVFCSRMLVLAPLRVALSTGVWKKLVDELYLQRGECLHCGEKTAPGITVCDPCDRGVVINCIIRGPSQDCRLKSRGI